MKIYLFIFSLIIGFNSYALNLNSCAALAVSSKRFLGVTQTASTSVLSPSLSFTCATGEICCIQANILGASVTGSTTNALFVSRAGSAFAVSETFWAETGANRPASLGVDFIIINDTTSHAVTVVSALAAVNVIQAITYRFKM